jgi:hypothetical protein
MKTGTMMLSASCVTNSSQMTRTVKHGFNAQNAESGDIQFAVETTPLVTTISVTFVQTDKFLKIVDFPNRRKVAYLTLYAE